MASSYTSNYQLCQWNTEDQVLRTEFNADNAKVDAGIKAVDRRVDSLTSTVGGKASQSALDSLSQTVAWHTAELAKKGNCQIYATKYTGNGKYDSANPNSLTFPAAPEVVYIGQGGSWLTLLQGETYTWAMGSSGGTGAVTVTWSGKTVRWYSTNAKAQMNSSSTSYTVIALIQVG